MSVLLFYCYYGKLASESYEMMLDCVFDMDWHQLPNELQKYFILMITNMQKPVYYHGFEVAKMDLGTFVNVNLTHFESYFCTHFQFFCEQFKSYSTYRFKTFCLQGSALLNSLFWIKENTRICLFFNFSSSGRFFRTTLQLKPLHRSEYGFTLLDTSHTTDSGF